MSPSIVAERGRTHVEGRPVEGPPASGGPGAAVSAPPAPPAAEVTATPLEALCGCRRNCGSGLCGYPLSMDGLEPVLPLLLAVVFGAAIGVERQLHHKSAGIKTNTLVALGAAGFSMLSASGFGPGNNPAQLAAAVVTGIGFIGAGVIIHRGASVQGVNTAATLWASASMGVAIGGRHYAVGASLFAAVLVVQLSAS